MSFDRNGAIKSRPFDRRQRVEVRPRRAKKRCFDLIHPLDLNPTIAIDQRSIGGVES